MLEGKIGQFLRERKLILSTSESCTGGLVSSRLIDVAGSSDYITLNFVTYANEAKERILGVRHETLIKHGAVSEECVIEMAKGTLKAAQADVALCTSGVAGPGDSENKPAGTLWISVAVGEKVYTKKVQLNPETPRVEMKQKFAQEALEFLYYILAAG
ncbi:MAG: CinA family protein [Fusobacterium sp.]|nr:CinA family protein [Fusobacterium sp.]